MNNGKKVLVVDDDTDIREIIQYILSEEGFEVTGLDNGRQVNIVIQQFTPDLILLDVMLGDADGRDICKTLKASATTACIPVIIVSATHGHRPAPGSADDCGADDYLPKPFDMAQLISKVKQLSAA